MNKTTTFTKHNPCAENGDINSIREEVLIWLDSGDVGQSSKAIAMHMAGIDAKSTCTPKDPSDFRRCLDMLKACPSIRNISSVVDKVPHYAPYIREWNTMIDLYQSDVAEFGKKAPNLYRFMKRLFTESLFIKGRVLFNCFYMDSNDFEKTTGIKPTLDNLFELNDLGTKAMKKKKQ
tara:strand:- start:3839 stop:4369 length:531 start_codon:yes stop_codon:yes gene_type:complete